MSESSPPSLLTTHSRLAKLARAQKNNDMVFLKNRYFFEDSVYQITQHTIICSQSQTKIVRLVETSNYCVWIKITYKHLCILPLKHLQCTI